MMSKNYNWDGYEEPKMSKHEIKHLEAAGKKYALLCQVATVGRDFIYDEEAEAINYFIDSLKARLKSITDE